MAGVDPFANDVLRRLIASNQDYQRSHGNYIVPLSQRLLDARIAAEALQHNTRRMLQALDGYWLHCDGLPKGPYPRGRYMAEQWWKRFEKYRAKVEAGL